MRVDKGYIVFGVVALGVMAVTVLYGHKRLKKLEEREKSIKEELEKGKGK